MIELLLLVVPLLGVLWFINLTTFLKKLKDGKDTHNQNVLGAVYTFFLLLALMLFFPGFQ
ncbi:hypothetical protein J2Z40_000144 [Cytobacillus eiseniae]|uniref:Uncharacterized protein n=1 Tax=Cytobacillus eiseniae TaxID=762947 RepID=A0ABS4RB33_9BACI|nr:hypothetical protein [Cytobacillus eiseniae]MBP2239591.1 hypothetical protein [Cytobacillus eiseniae]